MTRRYSTYDQYSGDDDARYRQQQRRAQQDTRGDDVRYQQRGEARGYSERLDYAAQNRDHGRMAQRSSRTYSSRQQASDYSRDRYTQQHAGQQHSARDHFNAQQQRGAQQYGSQQYGAQQQPQRSQQQVQGGYSGGHRHAELQQSAKIPRYNPEQDPRNTRSGQPFRVPAAQRPASTVGRYDRNSGAYQARPSGMEATVEKAGMFTSPISFLVRIAIIVVLLIVFGVRFAANSSTMQQLNSTQEQIATQQASLDDLNSQNEQLQSDIDSRQATLDAYKAKQQASS